MYQQRVEGLIGKREPRKDSSDVRVWYQVFPVDLSPGSLEMFAQKQHGAHSRGKRVERP